MATHHSVTVLCRELQAMSAANRTGSGTNAQLAKLVTKALADNQGLFEIVVHYGFILGDHANQFQSELTAMAMKGLANDLESYYHRIVELERHHNRMRNQGPEVGGWGGGNQSHQLQQSVPGSTSSKRRRRRNQFYPSRHGTTYDQHMAVFDIVHSDRAHGRYLAGFPEFMTTRHGIFYPPWGGKTHIRNVPELFAANRIFKAWANF